MKEIFKSEFRGFNEQASRIIIYEVDEYEYTELFYLPHHELCNEFGVVDSSLYEVPPGASYTSYDFQFADGFIIMIETEALNV